MNISKFSSCYGYSVCQQVCPRNIIEIVENNSGFYQPQISKSDDCVDSGRCLKVKDLLHLHDAIWPCEFLWLFSHASLVITTSFHGTAFAINFNKAFYSIINDVNDGDDRMRSLIMQCGLESRMIVKNGVIPAITIDVDFVDANNRLSVLRRESTEYLKINLR